MNKEKERICPVCGGILEEYDYAYDHKEDGKKYYRCAECGHKENIVE